MYDHNYFHKERWYQDNGLLRPDQYAALLYTLGQPVWHYTELEPRDPGKIFSIGCGVGDLEVKLEEMGYDVTGVDPYAKDVYKGKKLIDAYPGGADTIIMCESIEHIPRQDAINIVNGVNRGGRVVITNWVDFFPIPKDGTGWNHITDVDDGLYNEIVQLFNVKIRKGSHLVMDKL